MTAMNVSENLTEGKAHIGVLQANVDETSEIETNPDTGETDTIAFAKSALRKPMVHVDEDYFGTLHIDERMNLTTNINEDDESDSNEWLPCSCQAGWNDMNLNDQRGHSADSIFDCSSQKHRIGPVYKITEPIYLVLPDLKLGAGNT
jgi:hypothetical protein